MGVQIFLCAALLVLADTVITSKSVFQSSGDLDPPTIKNYQAEWIVQAGENVELECYGKLPVTWIHPTVDDTEIEDEPAKSIMYTMDTNDSESQYGVKLELSNVTGADVGYYSCMFNTSTSDTSEEISISKELESLEATGGAKRIYLYVNDTNKLLAPSSIHITKTENLPVIIPCRPTAPDVKITLYFNEKEVIPNRILEWLDNRKITFNRQKGFLLSKVKLEDNNHMINCTANKSGHYMSSLLMLEVLRATKPIQKPIIIDTTNGKVVMNENFTLECKINLEKNVNFLMEWIYPNPDKNSGRITQYKLPVQIKTHRQVATNILTVTGATREDEGNYECKITDHNKMKNSQKKFIKILDEGTFYLNLSTIGDPVTTVIKSQPVVNWIINIDSYPKAKITWYNNNNEEIINGVKYNVTIETSRIKSILQIKNILLSDFGVYRVEVNNTKEIKTFNFTLYVKDKPTVHMTTDDFYLNGTTNNFTCTVTGYPLPEISWYFTACDIKGDCNGSKMKLPEDNYKTETTNDVTKKSVATMLILKSGSIACSARNNESDTVSSSYTVTDIVNGFGIFEENGLFVVGDNLILTCAISKFYDYKALDWYKDGYKILENQNGTKNDYMVKYESMLYSNRIVLYKPDIKMKDEGDYQCKAVTTNDVELNKSLYVTVKDTQPSQIFSTNLNGSKMKHSLGEPLEFYCRINGLPKPIITWYKDDLKINFNKSNNRVQLLRNGMSLSFTHVKSEDSGVYKCTAMNRINSVSRSVELFIPSNESKIIIYIVVIIAMLIVFVIITSILVYRIMRDRKIRKELTIAGLLNFEKGATESLNPELGIDEQAELLPYDKKWEFPREKMKLGKQLGSGAFGVVMKASAYGICPEEESTIVAVKMVKGSADPTFIKALASELKIMVHLGKHINVVNLLGACTKNVEKRELLVIVEYCRFGNLQNYLLRHRANFIDQIDQTTDEIDTEIGSDIINRTCSMSSRVSSGYKSSTHPLLYRNNSKDDNTACNTLLDTANTVISMVPNYIPGEDGPITTSESTQPEWRSNYRGDYINKDVEPITTQDLLCWSFQVARGMEYLASRKVLHGDLAARNILLADNNIVKICDFGLAKSVYKNDNYKKKGDGPLPVKWMAIESIRDRIFSTQSDIWSFGIVLWELFSLAKTPYPGITADETFFNKLIEGYRMDKPDHANKKIYDIMLECWRSKPIQRPSFTDLAEKIGSLLEESLKKHYIDLNDPYMDMNHKWLEDKKENDYLLMVSSPDYNNFVSGKHEYVNDPFGGSKIVNSLSPDDVDAEGYLCMSPAKTSAIMNNDNVFDFPTNVPRILPESYKENEQKAELIPMLTIDNLPRTGSNSDIDESSLKSENNENTNPFNNKNFSNPHQRIPPVYSENNSPVKLCDDKYSMNNHNDILVKQPAFSNPSYVSVNNSFQKSVPNIYINIPTNIVT